MKHQLPAFLAGVAVTAMAFTCGPAIAAQIQTITASANTVNIALNGIQVAAKGESYTLANGTQVPYSLSYSGTTYLPIRKVGELVGQKIYWNGETGTAGVGVDPTKTPDATADYSTWTAEEEKAYQEFKGMWTVEEIDDNYTKQAFAWYKNQNDVALAKQAIKSLDKETVYKQMTRFVCETSYVGIRFNAGDKDGCLFVVTREGVGYDWVYQNGKVMN